MRLLALALLLLAAPAGATVIDFEAETVGVYFPSLTASGVTFSGSVGVQVADFGAGRALASFDDDSGHPLTLTFAAPVTALALDFGNAVTATATLEAYLAGDLVGYASVPMDGPGSISLSGVGPFDRALFRIPGEIDEIIDNVSFVPEPGTLGLVALALAATAGRPRRR